MKYCPNCGSQLPDEARFCPNCGAKQPQMAEPPEPVLAPEPQVQVQNPEASPSQRYRDLVRNDPVFKEIVVVRRKKALFELIFLVALIAWIVSMFVPVALFNGVNATTEGVMTMDALGKTLPHETCAYDLIAMKAAAGNYALTPGGLGSVYAVLFSIIGPIMFALIVVFSILKAFTGKSYVLKQYESGKVKELIKETMNPSIVGGFFTIAMITPALNLFLSAHGEEYKDGKTYFYGEIESIPSGFIAVTVIVMLLAAMAIAGTIVIDNILSKKLKEYAKNL